MFPAKDTSAVTAIWRLLDYSCYIDVVLKNYVSTNDQCDDFSYQPGNDHFYGARLIINDSLPASRYIKRFKEVANAIEKKGIVYMPGGTNSNATARTIIEAGLGIDIGASGHWAPGWNRNLLGDSWWQRWGR